MHALYNYKLRENENIRLKAENERKQTYIYYTLAISGILLSLGFGYLQYNRRKKTELSLQLEKTKRLKEEIQQKSEQFIKENESKIALLEKQLKESDNTLKQQLEAQREKMVYENKLAQAALDRQNQISKIIEESDIKKDIMRKLHDGDNNKNLLTEKDWKDIEAKIEENFPGFKIRLFDLYSRLSEHEYKICLLLKLEFKPIEIASLTLHSKESVASTRRRLYEKVFKCKGSPNDWDEIIRAI